MSRSNNTGRGGFAPPPQQPQQQPQAAGQWRHPLDMDEAAQHAPPPPHWAPGQHPQHLQAPHVQAPHVHVPDPYAAHGQQAPYTQHQPAAYGHPQQQGYPQPPQYDVPEAYDQQHGQHQDPYAHGAGHGGGHSGLASYSPQQAQELSTFAPPPQWPQPAPADPRTLDPRGGYDLGEYAPGVPASAQQGQVQAYAAEPAFSHDPYARSVPRTQPPGGWQPQPAPAYPQEPSFGPAGAPVGGYSEAPARMALPPAYPSSHVQSPVLAADPYRQPHAPGSALPQTMQPPVAPQQAEATDDIEYEDEDEPPRRGRTLLVVGALVGAIFVGGGLAYTYRALSGGGKTPILSTEKSAVRTKANTAVKAPEQAPKLPEVAPRTQVASEGDTAGPRRVATIPVGPDGSTQAPSPPPVAQPQTLTMPGLTVTMPPPMPQREAQLPPQQQPPPVRQQPAPPPVAQAPVQPKVITPPPQKQAALPEAAPAPPKKVVKQKEADAYSPGSGVTTAPPSGAAKSALGAGGNGFVAAILSTPKGKMEAMKSFADLQAKFPDVLNGKPAEVQEVNLGETKGVWYRAVVGPPGSRSAAAAVCEQLKAAGYTQCFATPY